MSKFSVRDGEKFIFIGDSITDCGWFSTERPYGNGYVSLFMDLQRWMFPEIRVEYANKGISGHTVLDLKNRWADNVVREKPDWLSIMIGINDCHRVLDGAADAQDYSPEQFRRNYDLILAETREKTEARVLLIDPFYFSTDDSGLGSRTQVLKLLPEYIAVVHDMAKKHKARLVRTQEMFQKHLKYVSPDYFGWEPIHPNRVGHLFIALEIMKALTA